MAINLNPGADSTLVSAAYRAAAGNKPGDYSRALEKAAEGYSKTMEASSEMWGKIGALGAAIGIEAVGNAQKQIEALALGDTLNPEKAGLFLEDFENIKGELRGLGMFSGRFGDKQTRIDRAGLMAKKKKLFAEIEGHVAGLAEGVGRVASGDFKIISPADDIVVGEMVNAIVKSNLKDNITGQGNEARLSRNETTGDLTYTMYKDNQPVLDSNQAPITMTMSQFSEAIANNTSDGGAKVLEFNKYTDKVYDRGLKSKTGEYDDSMKQADLNWVDTQIEKKADLKRAMNMTFGYSNTSFYDDITKNKNEYSSGLFGELLSIKGGEVLTGEITAGMIDKDGEAGISADEAMDKENYAMLTENLLGLKDENLTKAYFKDYVVKELEKTNDLGRSNKPPVLGINNDDVKDTLAGINGRMFNPITGDDEWVGNKKVKGKLTKYGAYDYDANNKKREAGIAFPDMFGNMYIPVKGGWKLKAAGSKLYKQEDSKDIVYTTIEAKINAFGGTYRSAKDKEASKLGLNEESMGNLTSEEIIEKYSK